MAVQMLLGRVGRLEHLEGKASWECPRTHNTMVIGSSGSDRQRVRRPSGMEQ